MRRLFYFGLSFLVTSCFLSDLIFPNEPLRIKQVIIESDTTDLDLSTAVDTIELEVDPKEDSINIKATSTEPSDTGAVYWQMSVDYDNDGTLDSIFYQSGPINPGTTPNIGLLIPTNKDGVFDRRILLKIELSSDESDFGAVTPSTDYNELMFRVGPTGGRVAIGSKKKSGENNLPQAGPCSGGIYGGIIEDNKFVFYMYNLEDNGTCTANQIFLTKIEIAVVPEEGEAPFMFILDPYESFEGNHLISDIKLRSYNKDNSYQDDNDGITLDKEETVKWEITFVPEDDFDLSKITNITIYARLQGCLNLNGTVQKSFCIGCINHVVYNQHRSAPEAGDFNEYIPPYTSARDSIVFKENAKIMINDSIKATVKPEGYIRLGAGTAIDSGAYFHAFIQEICNSFIRRDSTESIDVR